MARPLVVYFKSETYFHHSRRVYVAARTKKRAQEISGYSAGSFDKSWCEQFEAGHKRVPPFITDEGVWLEIRDLDIEGAYTKDFQHYSMPSRAKDRVPVNEAAFIRCATLEACKESFTLILDRALEAAGHPKEPLS